MGRPPRIRRDQLLATARKLFARKGFAAATLADIAGELGVTPAAVLRHVRSKQELFAQAMQSGEVMEPPARIRELANVDPASDPRVVLRSLAEDVVPFIQAVLATRIVVAMHENATRTSLMLPFNAEADNPPRRAFVLIANYFRRAMDAGVLRVPDPRAAALLFMGSLQGYVLFHHVLKITPVYPLNDFIDALIDLWCEGAIVGGTRGRKTKRNPASGPATRDRSRRGGSSASVAPGAQAGGHHPGRDAGGAHGQRRVARRRPRGTNARR